MSKQELQDFVFTKYNDICQLDKNTGFIVAKSGNNNTLNYSFIKDKEVIKPYWLMYEKKKENDIPTEDITLLERNLAYGTKIVKIDDQFYELKVVGYPNIPILLDYNNKSALVKKNSEYFKLIGLYVHENPDSYINKVKGMTVIIMDKSKTLQNFYISS